MAISVNWITGEIFVPRLDMALVQASPEIRELDVNAYRLELYTLNTSVEGRPWPKMYKHNSTYTIAGVEYFRSIEILIPYFTTFEENPSGSYVVNLVGDSNNNAFIRRTFNNVSVNPSNSAGGQVITSGSGLDAAQDARLIKLEQAAFNKRSWDKIGSTVTIYDSDNTTPLYVFDVNSDLSELTPQ